MLGIINKIWGWLQEGIRKKMQTQRWLEMTSNSAFHLRYQLWLLPFPACKGMSAYVLSLLWPWASLAKAFSVVGGVSPPGVLCEIRLALFPVSGIHGVGMGMDGLDKLQPAPPYFCHICLIPMTALLPSRPKFYPSSMELC